MLVSDDTFTITTAHQPVIFTGPVYFFYKILHAIKLAQQLKKELPQYNFVPVFYMGSEDADLDEIGTTFINNEKYSWQTKQTGATGRMKVDKAFTSLIDKMYGQVGNEKFGEELVAIFRKYYKEGVTIQQATLQIINELFGAFGLVVLIPDNANLKRIFNDVVQKELLEQFSHKAVESTIGDLQKHYKVQAGGRALNLFYLTENARERIEIKNDRYEVQTTKFSADNSALTTHESRLSFSKNEILEELKEHPERFSGNVILRGVFQETILPNIAFIGGGGELAYWLELKQVFEAVNVPYPVLLLRNSFLIMDDAQQNKIKQLGFQKADLFKNELALLNAIVARNSSHEINLDQQTTQLKDFYGQIKLTAALADNTLQQHVEALQTQALKKIYNLEKKMLRAERKKFETEQRQIQQLRSTLFPNNSLQERRENITGFYAKYGKDLIKTLLENSQTIEHEFAILNIK